MAEMEKCPGCGEPVEKGWTVCKKCLMPKDALSPVDEDRYKPAPPPAQSGLMGFLSLLTGLALLGAGYMYVADRKKSPPEPAGQSEAVDPIGHDSQTSGVRSEAARAILERPDQWDIKGQVYGLMSLKAVRGTELIFTDKTSGKTFKALPDRTGRYSVKLPYLSEKGYALEIRLKGSVVPYLEEMSPAYKSQDRDRRQDEFDTMMAANLLHVPILLTGNQAVLVHDLALLTP